MEEEFLDSSDEEKDFCDEDVKREGVLFNEAKILRDLLFKKTTEEIDYAATIRDWLAIGMHDYTNRITRKGKVYSKYLERKTKPNLSRDEVQEAGERLLEIFTPVIYSKFSNLVIEAREAKTLFCWLFNSKVKLPESLRGLDMASIKSNLLDSLSEFVVVDEESVIAKFAMYSLKSDLKHTFAKSAGEISLSLISSILYETRRIKDMSKALKISNHTDSKNLQSTLEMPYFGLSGSKGHHTVINPSLNSCSRIPTFTTYEKFLNNIPTEPKKLQLFTDCIFNFISGKSWEPKDVDKASLSATKGIAAAFVQSFFVESVRNPNTILIFPMWLELLNSNPKAVFPMSKAGAVANSRQLNHDYGYLLYQPFLLDYDQKNAKDSQSLLDLEASTLIDWLKFKSNIDISDMLLRASYLTKLVTYSAKLYTKLTCNDILNVHESFLALGGSSFLTKYEIALLSSEIDANKLLQEQVATRSSLAKVNPKNAIMGKYQDQLDNIKNLIKHQQELLLKEQAEFLKQIFIAIEESFSKWYNIEIPDELKITQDQIDYYDCNILEYLCKAVDKFSPFKIEAPSKDLSQITPKNLNMNEDYTLASQSPAKKMRIDQDQGCYDESRSPVFWSGEELETRVGQSPNVENQSFNGDFPEYQNHEPL